MASRLCRGGRRPCNTGAGNIGTGRRADESARPRPILPLAPGGQTARCGAGPNSRAPCNPNTRTCPHPGSGRGASPGLSHQPRAGSRPLRSGRDGRRPWRRPVRTPPDQRRASHRPIRPHRCRPHHPSLSIFRHKIHHPHRQHPWRATLCHPTHPDRRQGQRRHRLGQGRDPRRPRWLTGHRGRSAAGHHHRLPRCPARHRLAGHPAGGSGHHARHAQ